MIERKTDSWLPEVRDNREEKTLGDGIVSCLDCVGGYTNLHM